MQGWLGFIKDNRLLIYDRAANHHSALQGAIQIGGIGEHVGVLFAHGFLALVQKPVREKVNRYTVRIGLEKGFNIAFVIGIKLCLDGCHGILGVNRTG